MKYAAIDIGSNTVQMMIAIADQGQLHDRHSWLQTTRLGSAGSNTALSPESISDTVAAVHDFMEIINSEGVEACRILATSAVRDAENRQELLEAIASAAPSAPAVEILSGQQEALTSYQGVQTSINAPEHWPVLDLGGSSTELIYKLGSELSCVSGNIGAVRSHANGWDKEEICRRVRTIYHRENDADTLIGVGGTITSAAGVLAGLKQYDRTAIEGRTLRREELQGLYEQLLPLSLPERCRFSPLLHKRGEIIQEGLEILFAILELLQIEKLTVCGGGIMDGAIWQLANRK